MDLNEVSIFIKVARAASFTRAAKDLGIPISTASARVAALERRLGVTLLMRTTRKLRLTEEGEAFATRASRGLEEIFKAEAEVSLAHAEPQGTLRLTAPIGIGNEVVSELVASFRKRYPAVNLEFMITDRNVDLVAEGVDIAIRAGELQDSGLVARKIGTSQWIPVASPTYLRSAGTPGHPSDLREHVCLQFTPLGLDGWKLTDGRRTTIVPLKRQLVSNEIGFLKQLAVTANGVALLASHVCSNELASGELVRVLPTWSARSAPVHVVYPSQPFVAPKVRVFVDMAMEQLGSIFTP